MPRDEEKKVLNQLLRQLRTFLQFPYVIHQDSHSKNLFKTFVSKTSPKKERFRLSGS